jgi:hypothetical protein
LGHDLSPLPDIAVLGAHKQLLAHIGWSSKYSRHDNLE